MGRRHDTLESTRASLREAVHSSGCDEDLAVRSALRALDTVIEDHYHAVGAFARLSGGLSNAMKHARMVRLEGLSAQLRRTVHAAAREAGRTVDLELRFGDIELDRVVLERLRDPLTHLLRNAIDHGIEDAESRDLFGKPERGLVRVEAAVRGPTVELVVADDGRGFDLDGLRRSVVDKGLVAADEAESLDDELLVDFLFHEGFSTRARATRLSGRGVGLDVVRRASAALGGSVRAESRGPLGGAAFALRVPLSILSTGLLLVRASEVVYGVPVHAVERVSRVGREALGSLDGTPLVTLPGRAPMPLHWLARMLGGRPGREQEHLFVLTLSIAGDEIAVAVDEVLRDENLVVHRLPWNLIDVPGVGGAVAMPDGNVVVVVDVNHLFANRSFAASRLEAAEPSARTRVLVVDDSMTTRTLNRNVLVGAGYEVVLAADGDEAWRLLRDESVDVVVSDVQMPGMDGFELTRRIRSDPRLGSLPVILVTSLAKADDVQRGLAAGADEYVVKGPLEQDALLAAVKRHVG